MKTLKNPVPKRKRIDTEDLKDFLYSCLIAPDGTMLNLKKLDIQGSLILTMAINSRGICSCHPIKII